MSIRAVVNVFGMSLCSAFIATQLTAAQTPAAQTPSSQTPSSPAQRQEPARPADSSSKVTITGCVERSAAATSTPGATGTAGTSSFILTKAERAGAAARPPAAGAAGGAASSSASSAGMTYKLDADASKLTPHVNHKVEITGTIEPASASASGAAASGAAAGAGTLKVDDVKMLASSCSE